MKKKIYHFMLNLLYVIILSISLERNLFMKQTNEIIQRIKSYCVADDCIQVMIPYRDGITILSQDDILFHFKNNSNYYINKYLQDERRSNFLIQIYQHIIQE